MFGEDKRVPHMKWSLGCIDLSARINKPYDLSAIINSRQLNGCSHKN
jgi:hypothetical protein